MIPNVATSMLCIDLWNNDDICYINGKLSEPVRVCLFSLIVSIIIILMFLFHGRRSFLKCNHLNNHKSCTYMV